MYRAIKSSEITPLPKRQGNRTLQFTMRDVLRAKGSQPEATVAVAYRFRQIPDTFAKLEGELGRLEDDFSALATFLGREESRLYQYWGAMFGAAARYTQVIRRSQLFISMIEHADPLRLRECLESDLGIAIRDVKAALTRNEDEATEAVSALRDVLSRWRDAASQWGRVKAAIESSFHAREIPKDHYKELAHLTGIRVYDAVDGRFARWSPGLGFTSQPRVMRDLATLMAWAIKAVNWEFDAFAQLSAESNGLCTLLGLELDKRVIAVDNGTSQYWPDVPITGIGARVVLVDTTIQSGNHFAGALSKAGAWQVVGGLFLTRNDLAMDARQQALQIIDDMHSENELLYCFRMSELSIPNDALVSIEGDGSGNGS